MGMIQVLSKAPGIHMLAHYRASWLRYDIVAGLVLTTLLVPQGMAYAELAGLPVITGLYTTILCLIAYALIGPSRRLVLGPDSSLGPMIAATILPIMVAGGNPGEAVALASMLALLVGIIMLVAGIAKLGFVADLLSKPTQIGYMNGLALTIFVGQLPKLFGFSTDASGLLGEIGAFLQGLMHAEVVVAAAGIGLLSLGLVLVLERWLPRVPGVLVAVLVALGLSTLLSLEHKGVSLVGSLPQGLPPFTIPNVWEHLPLLLGGALGIALVALTDTISTASAFAARSKQEVHGNGEMIGIGAANIAAGLFQGFPVSTSGSRTAVAEQAGAKTQLTGLVGAAAIVLMLLLAPGLLKNLPQPTLAAIVIAAAISLADVPGMVRLWQQRRTEFMLAGAAFLGVAFLGVLQGIGIAVLLSILNVFRRVWWPYQTTLGRVSGLRGHHDLRMYPKAKQLSGVIIYRFDAPLLFANSRIFKEQMRHLARTHRNLAYIIIAAEPITDVDTTAADMLLTLDEELNAKGISIVFAGLKDPVRSKLERYELIGPLNPHHFYPTVGAAADAYRQQTGISWKRPKPRAQPDVAPASP
ncbi:MAG TPA: sulfate permease [Candidatus Saccharimonadales bacterium]|nr:sulfate permease [Candidatus Saccharimonadales bacterium]